MFLLSRFDWSIPPSVGNHYLTFRLNIFRHLLTEVLRVLETLSQYKKFQNRNSVVRFAILRRDYPEWEHLVVKSFEVVFKISSHFSH